MKTAHESFIAGLPKAELHLHIEGTLSPATVWKLAGRNGIRLPYEDIEAVRAASNVQAPDAPGYLRKFLKVYYENLSVLHTEQDFFEITVEYLRRCQSERVLHAEISFDPQAHTSRGVPFGAFMAGLDAGRRHGAENFGVSSVLIMCINRDRSAESAMAMYEEARPYRHLITGLGLDSVEQDNPPIKFRDVYERARADGYRLTAHCDVDQADSVEHIRQCLDILKVERIDHGINAIDDPGLVDTLRERAVCLTACPTWRPIDAAPRRVDRIRRMDELGLKVTINSDDPGLFSSGTLGGMLPAVAAEGDLGPDDLMRLMTNAFEGAWISDERRKDCIARLNEYRTGWAGRGRDVAR